MATKKTQKTSLRASRKRLEELFFTAKKALDGGIFLSELEDGNFELRSTRSDWDYKFTGTMRDVFVMLEGFLAMRKPYRLILRDRASQAIASHL